MFTIKSKKMTLPLLIAVISALLMPVLAQAELGGSGSTAARDAAAQKAAQERKLEKKRLKEEAAKKAAEGQGGAAPAEESKPADTQGEKPAPQ